MDIVPAPDRGERKKYCRVCGLRVDRLYKNSGGRRCAVCLHRTHGEHLAESGRLCARCSVEELQIPVYPGEKPAAISLLHLSDMHFSRAGRVEAAGLNSWLRESDIDYVLISGDLTARAGHEEYRKAARWLKDIELSGIKVGVVPGNHDIGYWGNAVSLGGQFAGKKYHHWIAIIDRPIEPCIRGPYFMALGLNSAHGISPTRFLNGFLKKGQRERAGEVLKAGPASHLKVVFCHHPLVRFPDGFHQAMFRAEEVRRELIRDGADLLLWGHQHNFNTAEYEKPGGKCIAVQGPTISERVRDGGFPGFAVVRWAFAGKVIIKSYRVKGGSNIVEDETVTYDLRY